MDGSYKKVIIICSVLCVLCFLLAQLPAANGGYVSDADFFWQLAFITASGGFLGGAITCVVRRNKERNYAETHLTSDGKRIEDPNITEVSGCIAALSDYTAFDSVCYKGIKPEGLEKLYFTDDLKYRISLTRNDDGGVTLKKEYCSREGARRALEKDALAYWTTVWDSIRNYSSLKEAEAAVPPEFRADDLKRHVWRKLTLRGTINYNAPWVKTARIAVDGKSYSVVIERGMTFVVSSAAHIVKIDNDYFLLTPSADDEAWEFFVKNYTIDTGTRWGVNHSLIGKISAAGGASSVPAQGKEENLFPETGKENAPALEEMKGAETMIAEDSRSFKEGREEIAPTATGETNSSMPQGENAETRSESAEMRDGREETRIESAEIAPDNRQGKEL